MRKIFSYNLRSGMSFDKPVYIDQDNIFLKEYEPITINALDKLEKWKIKELSTNGEMIRVVETKYENVLINKEECIEAEVLEKKLKKLIATKNEFNQFIESSRKIMNNAYKNISTGKPFEMNLVRGIADEIINRIKENSTYLIHLIHLGHESELSKHVIFTSFWGARLAENLSFSKPKIIELVYAMLLMDVGMAKTPEKIIGKKEICQKRRKN